MRLWIAALVVVIQGCTWSGPITQIENWPDLKVVEHRVSYYEMSKACAPYTPFLMTVQACSIFYAHECHIWYVPDWSDGEVLAYERDNCAGRTRPFWYSRMVEIRDEIYRLRRGG